MRKLDKFLSKLDSKRRATVLAVLLKLQSGKVQGIDIKKLKGASNNYRVRVGNVRILFSMNNKEIRLLSIGFRDDTTY